MNIQASVSEDHGIANLGDDDLQVYSVGISTAGVAEIRMAEANPKRHIIATTIDREGLVFAQGHIADKHLKYQIETKIEDVASVLPYDDNRFDYIYARLVLHYLAKEVGMKTVLIASNPSPGDMQFVDATIANVKDVVDLLPELI